MTTQPTPRRSQTPSVGVPAFRRWLVQRMESSIEQGAVIDRIRVIRTSSSDVEQWTASAHTSFASLDRTHDPDVISALEHGFDVVRRDAIGETKRQVLGSDIFTLRVHHAPGGVGRAQIGVVLHIGRTLFLYLLSSARAGNLQADNEERRGNAATEIIASAVREMFAAGSAHDPAYRPQLHAREHNRIVRSELHGTLLKSTLTNCRALVFIPHRCDLLEPAQAQSFTFGTLLEASAVEGLIRGMNRQEVLLQATGGFYEHIAMAPFTHGPLVTEETDGRTGAVVTTENVHRLAVVKDVEEAREKLRKMVDKILEPKPGRPGRRPVTDWIAVGNLAAELGLPSRRPEDVKKGIPLSLLGPSTRKVAARSLFQECWIEGWRTGSYEKAVPVKTRLDLELGDDVPYFEEGGVGHYRCRIRMPLPPGGWGISDDEWDEVLRRRYPERHDGVTRKQTRDCLPLAGLVRWDDDPAGSQFQLTTKSRRYVLRSRPLSEAYAHGLQRGWDRNDVFSQHATLAPALLHVDVARAMQQALEGLEVATVPFLVCAPVHGAQQTMNSEHEHEARVTEAELELAAARAQLEGAEDRLNEVRGAAVRDGGVAGEEDALERAEAARGRAHVRYTQARRDLDGLRAPSTTADAPPAAEAVTDEHVDTATAEFTSVALERCSDLAPPWLNEACGTFLTDWRMAVEHRVGARARVTWTCDLVLELVDTGEVIRIPLAGEVTSSSNLRTAGAATSVEDWAWRFFYLGESMQEIAAAAGLQPSQAKNSYVYSSLRGWLEPGVPDVDLRAAALQCPIPAVRRVLWAMVTGDLPSAAEVDTAFADHIRKVYSGKADLRSWSWCRETPALGRRVATLLAQQPNGTAPMYELVDQLAVGYDDILRLARTCQSPGTTAATHPLAYFMKTFKNPSRLAPDTNRLSLRPCPHRDCPRRLQGEQSYCTIILRTPETEAGYGVLCPACRRLPKPELSALRFPADYVRPWTGRFGRGSKDWAREQETSTFLEPGIPDPGAGPALRDTGSLPRINTSVGRIRTEYVTRAAVRESPLGAARFLLLDLDEDLTRQVEDYLREHGGRRAMRLRGSVAALIVPGAAEATDSPRASRAHELGVPVVAAADFVSQPPGAWAPPA